jgi:gluconolactonase
MAVDVRSEGLRDLLDEGVLVERLATGFTFTEGPIWNPAGYLLFSDMPDDRRRRFDEHGVREVASPTNKANGMTLDADGRLIVCEHSTSCVARMDAGGTGAGREVLASHFGDKELNSPNDIVVHSDGSVYFTDPIVGRWPVYGLEREAELDFRGVFRIPPEGGPTQLLADDFEGPNGLCFSPDESLLYVNDSNRAHIRVFDVGSNGLLTGGRVFAEGIGTATVEKFDFVDGMKCDEHGNIWLAGPNGVWIFSPAAEHLGVVRIPEPVGNLHWGGPSWSTMYVCASTSLYRFETKTSARREPFMR